MPDMAQNSIPVLDKGHVRLLDTMGNDAAVVDAARVSWNKRCILEDDGSLAPRDEKLLGFLVKEGHTSPFRHAIVKYEIYAPLMIKNQWIKHLIGGTYSKDTEFPGLDPFFAWNESSRRYVTEQEEFYIPGVKEWRSKPANSKQGSGPNLEWYSNVLNAETDVKSGDFWRREMNEMVHIGVAKYKKAMDAGIAPEQARLFLPAYAMYVRWQWTTSLQGVMHFLGLRDEAHAQHEIREYARAVKELTRPVFPVSIGSLDVEER